MSGLVDIWTSERARLSSQSQEPSSRAPPEPPTQLVAQLHAQEEEVKRGSAPLSSLLSSSKLRSFFLLAPCSEASVSALVHWFSP